MQIEILVRMANDIGAFFGSEPDQAEAARNITVHIKRYWDPRMRRQIAEHCRAGGEGLAETVKSAVALLADPSGPSGPLPLGEDDEVG